MKIPTLCLSLLLAGHHSSFAETDSSSVFEADLKEAKAKYRLSYSEVIAKANRVIIYLVDFEAGVKANPFENHDNTIAITPYNTRTKILSAKELTEEDRKKLLKALTAQIAKPEHSGGAFCHLPIHGVRVYQGDNLLHEGTFCWDCGNFSFTYPEGSDWLDTTKELQRIFTELMPIPSAELDRLHQKHPDLKPTGEPSDSPKNAADKFIEPAK